MKTHSMNILTYTISVGYCDLNPYGNQTLYLLYPGGPLSPPKQKGFSLSRLTEMNPFSCSSDFMDGNINKGAGTIQQHFYMNN